MLVLERKSGESIVIQNGEETIEIKIDKQKKDVVKLVFNAPQNYVILRKELTSENNHEIK